MPWARAIVILVPSAVFGIVLLALVLSDGLERVGMGQAMLAMASRRFWILGWQGRGMRPRRARR